MAYGNISNQTFNFDPSTIRINANQIDGQITNSQIASISAAKVSGTLAVNNIPNLDASKITSGILSLARGGTGVSSLSELREELGVIGTSVTSKTFSYSFTNTSRPTRIYSNGVVAQYLVFTNGTLKDKILARGSSLVWADSTSTNAKSVTITLQSSGENTEITFRSSGTSSGSVSVSVLIYY